MFPLRVLFVAFSYFYIAIKQVFADYCEFGTCDENSGEYCCGENKCCKKTVEVWYYWAVVLLVIIIVIIATCFYVKTLKSKYKTYSKLDEQFDGLPTQT